MACGPTGKFSLKLSSGEDGIRLLSLSNCMRACLQARASLCGVRTKLLVFDKLDKIFFIIVES